MKKHYLLLLLGMFCGFTMNAQILFQENFDTGIPGTWAITDFLGDGSTWQGTTNGYGGGGFDFLDGTEFAIVDSDSDGNGIDMVETLTSPVFDGTLYGPTVFLEFDHYFRFLTAGSDFATVEVFDGATWQLVATFQDQSYGAWNAPDQQSIDISAYSNPNMQIRFHFDDNNTWAWYWAVDNVVVLAPVPDDAGAVAILNASALGMTATESIEITVENFGGNSLTNVPVYYRINGGAPVGPEVLAGPIIGGGTANHIFAATADFSAAGSYLIEAWTEYPGDGDLSNDTVSKTIINAINPVVSLPFCADFEDATNVTVADGNTSILVGGLPYLKFESGTNGGSFGRIRTEAGAGFAQSGTKALTIDMNPSGGDILNYATLQLNMSAYDANTATVLIDYSIMEHGDEVQPGDSVWIRGSDTDSWIAILAWNDLTGGINGQYFTVSDFDLSATLLANSQNFSSTFEFRIGQEDNFPATTTTASDGVTLDDVCIRQLNQNDASPLALLEPVDGGCGSSTTPVCATITNLGTDTITSMPVTLNWTNGTISGTETITYSGSLPYNGLDTICFTPINTSTGGAFTFEVITELSIDEMMANDTLWAAATLSNTTLDIDTAYCLTSGDSLALAANVLVPGAVYNWYDSLVGGNLIHTGDTLWTGALTNDTSFFVESASSTTFSIGAPDLSIGASATYSFYADGLVFDVQQAIVIDSMTIYPESAGDVVINLLDNIGTVVNSVTVTVAAPTVAFEPTRIGVNLPVGIGNGWQLEGTGTTVTQMMRNSGGAAYPYTEPGVMEITGPINALAGYYYFWYDWRVTASGCTSERVEVAIEMNPTVTPATIATDSICIDATPLTLGEGTPAGGTFSGTGVTGSSFDPAAAGAGAHIITYSYISAGGCVGSADLTVTVEDNPTVTAATIATDSMCVNSAAIALGEGTPAGGTFSGTGVSGAMFDPAVAGVGTHTISYTFTSAAGCSGSADLSVTVDGCIGIEELETIAVNLYPNPATDLLNIEVAGTFNYSIVDMRGALVATGNGNNLTSVPTTNFEPGVYLVNILTSQGGATARLIVQ